MTVTVACRPIHGSGPSMGRSVRVGSGRVRPVHGSGPSMGRSVLVGSQNFPSSVSRIESGPVSKMSNKYALGTCLRRTYFSRRLIIDSIDITSRL